MKKLYIIVLLTNILLLPNMMVGQEVEKQK